MTPYICFLFSFKYQYVRVACNSCWLDCKENRLSIHSKDLDFHEPLSIVFKGSDFMDCLRRVNEWIVGSEFSTGKVHLLFVTTNSAFLQTIPEVLHCEWSIRSGSYFEWQMVGVLYIKIAYQEGT